MKYFVKRIWHWCKFHQKKEVKYQPVVPHPALEDTLFQDVTAMPWDIARVHFIKSLPYRPALSATYILSCSRKHPAGVFGPCGRT